MSTSCKAFQETYSVYWNPDSALKSKHFPSLGDTQVATPRVRLAAKAAIPHVEDHVSKLEAVGKETRNKLEDINAAAACMGIYGVTVPHNSVTTGACTCP